MPLGRWFGVHVNAHWSVLVMVGLFAALLATSEFPALAGGHSRAAYWAAATGTATMFLATLLAHELAHAAAAHRFGVRVDRVTLWMLGGFTELHGEPRSPRQDGVIAGAGPATSLLIGGACLATARWMTGPGLADAALAWLGAVNLVLAVFNLLPGAPLDGGRLLRAYLWHRRGDRASAVDGAASAGRVLGTLLIALGLLQFLVGSVLGLWLAMIGWFILSGSAAERSAGRMATLKGLHVADVMTPNPVTAAEWWTVEQFLSTLRPVDATQPLFPVVDLDGNVTGSVLPVMLWSRRGRPGPVPVIRDLRRKRTLLVAPETPLLDVLAPLHVHGGVAVVVEGLRPVGLLTEPGLLAAARLAPLSASDTKATPDAYPAMPSTTSLNVLLGRMARVVFSRSGS